MISSRKWLFDFFGLVFGAAGVVSFPILSHSEQVIRLGTQELAPHQLVFQKEDGEYEMTGKVFRRVQCALDTLDRKYTITLVSGSQWSELQERVQANEFDGFFAGARTEQRATYAVASDPVIEPALSFFVAKGVKIDAPLEEDQRTAANYAAKFGTPKWSFLFKNGYNVTKRPQDTESLIKMLNEGVIDVAYENDDLFMYASQQLKIDPSIFNPIWHRTQSWAVHFTKTFIQKEPAFLTGFNDALNACIAAEGVDYENK